jgi:hypothetical protein
VMITHALVGVLEAFGMVGPPKTPTSVQCISCRSRRVVAPRWRCPVQLVSSTAVQEVGSGQRRRGRVLPAADVEAATSDRRYCRTPAHGAAGPPVKPSLINSSARRSRVPIVEVVVESPLVVVDVSLPTSGTRHRRRRVRLEQLRRS